MKTFRPSWAVFAALVAAALVSPPSAAPASAATNRSQAVAAKAVAWIATEQRADGGFGSAEPGFPGFETPDAVLAIADAAQTTTQYRTDVALTAVRAVKKNGVTALHYLDDLADDLGSQTANARAGRAAQLSVVARSLGLEPKNFDPDGDGATDLVAAIDAGRQSNGSYGNLGGTLFVLLADRLLGRTPPVDTIAFVEGAQQGNGGWGFAGDPNGTDEDVDTTSRAVQALIAAGRTPTDASIAKALALLVQLHNADGSWSAFGSPDPNATAMAVLAITSAGFNVADRCWMDAYASNPPSVYVAPDVYLRSQQAADGHIASPSDEFGVNTFATSQGVQALIRTFQPVARAGQRRCPTRGYRLVARDGGVFAFGAASFEGSTGDLVLNQPIVAAAATPSGRGYWLFAADGGVFAFGDAEFLGSTGLIHLAAPIVAAAITPDGGGYWLFGRDGGVFNFGDADFFGSGVGVTDAVVGAAAAYTGRGYVLVDASQHGWVFDGSEPHRLDPTASRAQLNAPVAGAAVSLSGGGYWVFARDGGVFAYGDAPFAGSAAAAPLNEPIVGGTASREDGYYLFAGDGGVFAFGGAPFLGSTGDRPLNQPVTTMMG